MNYTNIKIITLYTKKKEKENSIRTASVKNFRRRAKKLRNCTSQRELLCLMRHLMAVDLLFLMTGLTAKGFILYDFDPKFRGSCTVFIILDFVVGGLVRFTNL